MTKLELQQLLEEAYSSFFLDSIELLAAKEAEYRKSDFFKKTKLSLSVLYKQYFIYQQSKYGLSNKIDEFINEIDTEKLEELLIGVVEKLSTNDKLNSIINKFAERFDLKSLIENSEELQTILKNFKK